MSCCMILYRALVRLLSGRVPGFKKSGGVRDFALDHATPIMIFETCISFYSSRKSDYISSFILSYKFIYHLSLVSEDGFLEPIDKFQRVPRNPWNPF